MFYEKKVKANPYDEGYKDAKMGLSFDSQSKIGSRRHKHYSAGYKKGKADKKVPAPKS